ncbi:hypothetical protein RRG08_012221 [Elysia crispata]|uniref:Uncharacterized protein n=1 Tax=Elysia crispata TaxID=231223 RepID=A0AAE1DAP0_9GAST|nr:hypothetical protein RRG08_012221 [Elysia crispata]
MNSEGDYSITCNMDSHHGYPSGPTGTYSTGTLDIYGGFHQQHQHQHHHHTSISGSRSPMDSGQHAGYYGSGDASLSPQLGTPGELPPLSSGGTHHQHHHSTHQGLLSGYASAACSSIHTTRGSSNSNTSHRNQMSGYPHTIPTAHTHHHHHQNNSHQQHHHHQQIHSSSSSNSSNAATTEGITLPHSTTNASNNNLLYSAATQMPHDLVMTANELYHSSTSPHHSHSHQHHHHQHANISTTPNFLEIGAAGSHIGMRSSPGYHHHHSSGPAGTAAGVVDQKYSLQAQLSGHSVITGALTNGYLPPPPPTSSPLKSESGSSQPGLQGKPFRWMTIKRTPAKPGKYENSDHLR